jgi:hypothetical protein
MSMAHLDYVPIETNPLKPTPPLLIDVSLPLAIPFLCPTVAASHLHPLAAAASLSRPTPPPPPSDPTTSSLLLSQIHCSPQISPLGAQALVPAAVHRQGKLVLLEFELPSMTVVAHQHLPLPTQSGLELPPQEEFRCSGRRNSFLL